MITGEAAAAVAVALCATSAALITIRRFAGSRREDTAGVEIEAEVRLIMFRAIDEGDLSQSVVDSLTGAQHQVLEAQAKALLPKLRGEDRDTLGRMLDRLGAIDSARRQARSKRADVRAGAGEFLGESGSSTAVRDLLDLLKDPDSKVRWSAARGLGRLGNPSAVTPLLASIDGPHPIPVDVIADAVLQIRECPVPVLRQGLASHSVPTRAVTVELLGRFQALVAADEIISLLDDDPSVEVRARAARSLGRMGSPRAVRPLLSYVEAGPAAVRAQAIWALGEIGAVEALPALRATLLGPAHHLSELAADALLAMGPLGINVLTEVAVGQGGAATIASRCLNARHLQTSQA